MENLRNIRYFTWRPPLAAIGRQLHATCWDASSDSLICAYGPNESNILIELIRVKVGNGSKDEHTTITSWDAPSPNPDLPHDQILSLHYFGDSMITCLVLAGGDIVVVSYEPQSAKDRIEIIGSVEEGITGARWSPDEDILAITTKANTVVFMSRSFEVITDITMSSENLKASNHVSVGWGKKETQFKGKGAKALRDPTMPERIQEGVLSPHDSGRTNISWRGDGAYVAVSVVHADARRLIRVYSREGVLDSVSEPVDGLEGALSWRPAGNLIAAIQRSSDHINVVFFERNGLRHGGFRLRLSPEEVNTAGKNIQLSWNNDSTVLAVILDDSVQLWTMGNYHWYLKQELVTARENITASDKLVWHPEKALLLALTFTDSITTAEYVFSVARGCLAPPNDYGAVAVIDGKTLNVTPFRTANIPPPMALYVFTLPQNIADVTFGKKDSSIAVLHNGGIALYHWDHESTSFSPPTLIAEITFKQDASKENMYQQICFGHKNAILVLFRSGGSEAMFQHYRFYKETRKLEETRPFEVLGADSALMLFSFEHNGSVRPFFQKMSGQLQAFSTGDELLDTTLDEFVPWIEVTACENIPFAVGLSRNGHLYANSRLLVKNCTSFLVTPLHIIFTTTTHLLKFVHITCVEDMEVPPDDPEKDERCRSIERGARLITAIPTSLCLVLQMPRGNLETIWPRAMVLDGVRKLINEKNYRKAFSVCRSKRVDMNILYDHSPEQFMSYTELFIDQVKEVAHIDLFLSSLREEDVTQTMYKETRAASKHAFLIFHPDEENEIKPNTKHIKSSKINRICDAVLEVLKTRTATNLQNIITAHVSKSPPALEDGLLVVASLMKENESLAEEAAVHIGFLADANKLYDIALGLYNLDLALLIAQQSQKDPREYLPFLQKLQEMDTLRRQFTIDDYLGRHAKALEHLYGCLTSDDGQIEAYTVKHSLYTYALALYRYQPNRLESIMSLYATYLELNSHFREAAIAYESLHLYVQATSCYQRASASHWRECLFCASQQTPPLEPEAFTSLATSLAESLVEAKDYESAASIHATYLSSIPTAVGLLCKGYHFAAALQLASLHSSTHSLLLAPDGPLDTYLTDALSSSTELLAECKAQLLAQVPRIQELRLKAAADPLAFYEGETNEDIPDDISVAASSRLSTSASLFTRYTGRQSLGTAATGVSRATSKNRRREERKRARGKKGSVYEEEYLVASLGRLIERVDSVREEVERLVVGLVRRRMRERAQAVEQLLGEVVEMCRGAVVKVFEEEKNGDEKAEDETRQEGYRPVGGDAVLAESIAAAGMRKIAPHIGAFEKLTLLGT